jgi:Fur family ferric uptake transcriptional regulator
MEAAFKKALKDSGNSITLPRMAVFNYMLSRGPVTINALIEATLPRADRASIYRALELFRELGIVEDLVVGGQKVIELSQQFSSHHHHITCTNCGKTLDLTDKAIEKRLDSIAEFFGFKAAGHQIEISGLCPNCQ